MKNALFRLPEDVIDRIHAVAESQHRLISDVTCDLLLRGLASLPEPTAVVASMPVPAEG